MRVPTHKHPQCTKSRLQRNRENALPRCDSFVQVDQPREATGGTASRWALWVTPVECVCPRRTRVPPVVGHWEYPAEMNPGRRRGPRPDRAMPPDPGTLLPRAPFSREDDEGPESGAWTEPGNCQTWFSGVRTMGGLPALAASGPDGLPLPPGQCTIGRGLGEFSLRCSIATSQHR
jgi:hypothetical protein